MPTCPNGHQSGSEDWCEVCGHRMTDAPEGRVPPPPPNAPGVPSGGYGYPGPPQTPQNTPPGGYGYPDQNQPPPNPPGPPPGGYGYPGPPQTPRTPPATAQAELCPRCRTPREAQAPFCEECRYNFLTQSPTTHAPPVQPPPGMSLPPGFQPQQPHGLDYHMSRPSQLNRPAEPLTPDPPSAPQAAPQAPPAPSPGRRTGDDEDFSLSPPGGAASAVSGPFAPPAPPRSPQAPSAQPSYPDRTAGRPSYGDQAPAPLYAEPAAVRQQAAEWVAVIGPDREYFRAMMNRSGPEAAGLNLPAYCPEQRLPLTGSQVTIGRRRHSTGESPDIDLSRPPEDPGVSHQHAVLVLQPDGGWSVVDQDSTNGTTINGGEDPIQPYVPVPLQEGDRVHVGAWTTITLRRD